MPKPSYRGGLKGRLEVWGLRSCFTASLALRDTILRIALSVRGLVEKT